MSRPGLFLCGCDPTEKISEFGSKRFDTLGFEVCPEHGDRLYGYRSHLLSKSASDKPLNLNFGDARPNNQDPLLSYVMLKASQEVDETEGLDIANIAGSNGHIRTEPPIL